ncbi:hypothetical protein [Tahibacter harae]|nr:hypothetical protein [Tahibacter harae]
MRLRRLPKRQLQSGGDACAAPLDSPVRRIALLRHAEKRGCEQPGQLSGVGHMRAFALPHVLADLSRRDGWLLAPDRLIAAADTPRSRRPSQTLAALGRRLGLRVLQVDAAAALPSSLFDPQILPDWHFAVISWRRSSILRVARLLGAAPQDLPAEWPRELYDQIILLDYDAAGRVQRTRCVRADQEVQLRDG